MKLSKEEIQVLIQVLNMPRNQNLQSAQFCINLSNKLSKMLDDSTDNTKDKKEVANPKK